MELKRKVFFTLIAVVCLSTLYLSKDIWRFGVALVSTEEESILYRIQTYTSHLPNTSEVTIVTAYFNLGPLQKQSSEGPYTPGLYKRWMGSFAWIDNPLIVYTDNNDTATYFRQLRARYPPARTKIILLSRDSLWAFRLEKEIKAVYSQPGYPRHSPNTINPLYSCAMHAKFELIQRTLQEQLHQGQYIAWLDIGLFRTEASKNNTMHLTVPVNFDRTKVFYSQVYKFENATAQNIIAHNKVWVGGASFLAIPEVAYVFCSEYRRAVRKMLDMKIMSTDQQVIYSMYQQSFDFHPRVYLQTGSRDWFGVGYSMKQAP